MAPLTTIVTNRTEIVAQLSAANLRQLWPTTCAPQLARANLRLRQPVGRQTIRHATSCLPYTLSCRCRFHCCRFCRLWVRAQPKQVACQATGQWWAAPKHRRQKCRPACSCAQSFGSAVDLCAPRMRTRAHVHPSRREPPIGQSGAQNALHFPLFVFHQRAKPQVHSNWPNSTSGPAEAPPSRTSESLATSQWPV